MWIIQEPNTLELWNKLHFEEEIQTESIYHVYDGEWKVKTDDLYTIILKIYYKLYTIKLKLCTQRFYYSYSKFSKFIQGMSFLQYLASVSLLKEKSKIYPKLIELLSWNGPTVHVCCFMLTRASTKTFVSRIHIR